MNLEDFPYCCGAQVATVKTGLEKQNYSASQLRKSGFKLLCEKKNTADSREIIQYWMKK